MLTAHRELEKLVGTIHQNGFKARLDDQWAFLVYAGLWQEPLLADLDAFMESVNAQVTGTITMKLYKGSATVTAQTVSERSVRPGARRVRRVRWSVLAAG